MLIRILVGILCCFSLVFGALGQETAPEVGAAINEGTADQVVELAQLNTAAGTTGIAGWSPNGQAIVAASNQAEGGVWVYDLVTWGMEPQRIETGSAVTTVGFGSSDPMNFLVTGGEGGAIRITPVPTGLDMVTIDLESQQTVNSLAVSQDMLLIAAATGAASSGEESENVVHLYDARSSRLLEIIALDAPANVVAFSAVQGGATRLLAVGDNQGIIQLFMISAEDHIEQVTLEVETSATLLGHEGAIFALQFSPDGALLASGSLDGQVRIWDTNVDEDTFGAEMTIMEGKSDDPVLALAFNPEGSVLAAAGGSPDGAQAAENTISLWRMDEPLNVNAVATLSGHTGAVRSLAFEPESNYLLSASDDGTLRLWGIPAGES